MIRLIISSTTLLAAFACMHLYSYGEATPIRRPLHEFSQQIGEFDGQESTVFSDEILDVLRPTDYLFRRYENPQGQDIWLYLGYWETQRTGAQMHSPKNCLPGGGWQPLEASVVEIPVANGSKTLPMNRYILQKGGSQLVVGYTFLSQGEPVANELDAKMLMIKNSILKNRSDGAILRVSAGSHGNPEATWNLLVRYVQVLYPKLKEHIPQ